MVVFLERYKLPKINCLHDNVHRTILVKEFDSIPDDTEKKKERLDRELNIGTNVLIVRKICSNYPKINKTLKV